MRKFSRKLAVTAVAALMWSRRHRVRRLAVTAATTPPVRRQRQLPRVTVTSDLSGLYPGAKKT